MLTLTPPEAREDADIQVDNTHTEDTDRSSARVGLRKRLGAIFDLFLVDTDNIKFDPDGRSNQGFNLIELVIGVVALVGAVGHRVSASTAT